MKKIGKALLTTLFVATLTATVSCNKDKGAKFVFNVNGGEAVDSINAKVGDEVTLPVPEKEGYEFLGWYDNETFTGDAVEKVSVEKNGSKTYYAKWEKLCAIKLNLDGGTLDKTTYYIKKGENAYTFLQDKVPQKTGFVFGGWFNGTTPLDANTKITENGLELTAKYKVAYTVEVYVQKLDGTGYELTATNTEYGFVGEKSSAVIDGITTNAGYREVDETGAVKEITLSENSANNVCKRYFARNEYAVTFLSNYPTETENEAKAVTIKYGQEFYAPYDYFTAKGYYLAGWSYTQDGEVAFATNAMEARVFNDTSSAKADLITVDKKVTLYAVWVKGYANIFAGEDYIYLPENSTKIAYLCRGGEFFKGSYSAARHEFAFYDKNDDTLLEGVIYPDGTYCYYNTARSEKVSNLYDNETNEVNEYVKVLFKKDNGITYVDYADRSEGTYNIDENGYYVCKFTSGKLEGQTLTLSFGSFTQEDGTETNVFRVRNDEEYGMVLYRGVINPSNMELAFYSEVYKITLGGFGIATYRTASSVVDYYYTLSEDGETLTLKDNNNNVVGIAYVSTMGVGVNTNYYYMFRDEEYNGVFRLANGERIELDGIKEATYYGANGSVKAEGYYTKETSVFGGVIVNIDGRYKFLITKSTTSDSEITEEGEEPEVVYTTTLKPIGYKEYYFKNGETTYYAPLIVEDDTVSGKASLYGYTEQKTFVKVSTGTYTTDATGKKTYTATEWFTGDVITNPLDAREVATVVYGSMQGSSYNVTYWYSYTDKAEHTTYYGDTYTSTDGKTLTLNSGFAVYKDGETTLTGSFTQNGKIVTANFTNGTETTTKYFEVEETAFTVLTELPHTNRTVNADGTISKDSITFDGKGGAVYTVVGENNVETTYTGTFAKTGTTTDMGAEICSFTSTDMTFNYVMVNGGTGMYVVIYDNTYEGVYTTNVSRVELTLDGYGFAKYKNAKGEESEVARYNVKETNVVYMTIDGVTRYFDLTTGNKFAMRGVEYGEYSINDNRAATGKFVELDGYGVANIFTEEDGTKTNVATGSYTVDGEYVSVEYALGNENVVYELKTSKEKYESYGVLNVIHETVQKTYVNEKDWTMLVLDNSGNAVKYDANGIKQTGYYTLITDTLLFFETTDGEDGCMFTYNSTNGTATPITKLTARGYYTKDLDSLLFSSTGFAIFNGGDRLFYNIVNGKVVIYRHSDASSANDYGFEEEDFGTFENEKDYNGKKYYSNSGFSVKFIRNAENASKYPVLLTVGSETKYPVEALDFAPNGKEEFTIRGAVTINGRNYVAYVTRESDGHGGTKMYMTVGTYRFDLEITYNGEDEQGESLSSYKITSMSSISDLPSYTYLDTYYRYYINYGRAVADAYKDDRGHISIVTEFDEAGEEVRSYVSASFGEGAHIYDSNGNILVCEECPYEYDSINKIYTVTVEGDDGYTYRIYFGRYVHSAYTNNTSGYYIHYVSREETLTTADGYTLYTERVVATDNPKTSLGVFVKIQLEKNEEEIKYSSVIKMNGKIYYISREIDEDGKITSSTYYLLNFVENQDGEIDESEYSVPTYAQVTVEKKVISVIYSADGKNFVEVDDENNVVFICVNNVLYLAHSCEFDTTDNSYTVVVGSKTFKVTVNGEKTEIVSVEELQD